MGRALVTFETGKARLASSVRGVDEAGHDMFELQLANYPSLYGEWKPKFADNHNDFDVEIVSFGYANINNAGNDHPQARRHFSAEARETIQELICALFSSPTAREGTSPFTSTKGKFLGSVHFLPGWLIER